MFTMNGVASASGTGVGALAISTPMSSVTPTLSWSTPSSTVVAPDPPGNAPSDSSYGNLNDPTTSRLPATVIAQVRVLVNDVRSVKHVAAATSPMGAPLSI